MRIDERSRARFLKDCRANVAQVSKQLFLLLQLVHDLLSASQDTPEIDDWPFGKESVSRILLRIAHQAGCFCQDTSWNTAIIRAGSAQASPLDQGDCRSQFAGTQRSRHARRPTADNRQIEVHGLNPCLAFTQS